MSETSEATPLSPAGSKPQVIVVKDTLELAERAAAHVATLAREAIRARGSFHVALAGGTTPRTMYEKLSTRDDSNYRMVKESLLERTPIPSANVHRMEADEADLEAAAAAYSGALPEHL